MKIFAVALCVLVTFATTPGGSVGLRLALKSAMQGNGDIPDYAVDPVYLGDPPNPDADDVYRAATWTDDSIQALGAFQAYDILAVPNEATELSDTSGTRSLWPETLPSEIESGSTGTTGLTGSTGGTGGTSGGTGGSTAGPGDTGSGPGFPWEGTAPGGGSPALQTHVVTNTGNRFTAVPIVSWPMKGAYLSCGLTLYHNSRGAYGSGFGSQWSSDYDAGLTHAFYTNPTTQVLTEYYILRWGNGQTVPFTVVNGVITPPKGLFDTITANGNDRIVTTPAQIRYTFTPYMSDGRYGPPMTLYRLREIRDRDNVFITINRGLSGLISTVNSNDGRSLTFNYYTGTNNSMMVNTITDPLGRVWVFDFGSGSGTDLLHITYPPQDPNNPSIVDVRGFVYDTKHEITAETDLRGNVWHASYMTTTTGQYTGQKIQYAWAPDSNNGAYKLAFAYNVSTTLYPAKHSTVTLPDTSHGGASTWMHFYNAGMLYNIVGPAGFNLQMGSDGFNEFGTYTTAWIDTANGNTRHTSTWTIIYTNGNVTSLTDPVGHVTTAQFDANNNPLWTTESPTPSIGGSSLTTNFYYTTTGDLQEVRDNTNLTTGTIQYIHYDSVTGLVDWIRDGPDPTTDSNSRAVTTHFQHDSAGHGDVTQVSTPSGHEDFTFDALGETLTYKDGLARQTSYTLDGRERLKTITRPDPGTGNRYVNLTYDHEDGLPSSTSDELSRVTSLTYDSCQQLYQLTNARLDMEQYGYDRNGWLTSVQNGRNYTRGYKYSLGGEVTQLTMPSNAYEKWSYGALGEAMIYQHLQTPNSTQKTIRYDHDDAFEPTAIKYGGYTIGTDTTLGLDGLGRIQTMSDLSGTSTWNYDSSTGRLTSFSGPQGVTLGYGYFDCGRRKSMTQTNFTSTNYDYDSSGRLGYIANTAFATGGNSAGSTSISYFGDNQVQSIHRPNGHWTNYSYNDARGRLTEIAHVYSTGAGIRTEDYGYDDVDNLTSRNVSTLGNFVYSYDNIHQLTGESLPYIGNNWPYSYTLDYDSNGNRWHKYWSNGNTDTYAVDHDDRLLSVSSNTGTVSHYGYDNYLRPTAIGPTNNQRTLSWDVEDRLLSVSQGGGTLGSYGYNGAGARVSKNAGNISHYYARDDADVTSPILNESLNNGPATNYVPGIGLSQSSTTRTFASDHLGTHNHEIDGTGNIAASREYDAFGNLQNGPRQGYSPYGYAGDEGYLEDDESGLTQVGCRMYDPGAGRFLTDDPEKDGPNWGTYCASNPTGAVDPTGGLWFILAIDSSTGLGYAYEFLSQGDTALDDDGNLLYGVTGTEFVRRFRVSNRPAGKHKRFHDGTYTITDTPRKGKGMGPRFEFRGKKNGSPARRGTWWHSWDEGMKRTWKSKTHGCARSSPDNMTKVRRDYFWNKRKGNKQTVTVIHYKDGN